LRLLSSLPLLSSLLSLTSLPWRGREKREGWNVEATVAKSTRRGFRLALLDLFLSMFKAEFHSKILVFITSRELTNVTFALLKKGYITQEIQSVLVFD
jgi:hypothetical protein